MLEVPPDITLQSGRAAYSPRQAGLVANLNAVTIKRLFDRGDLAGEKIPSRGKKEFYAIYPESLEALIETRTRRAPPVSHRPDLEDVMGLLQTAQAHSRIAELESQVAVLELSLQHLNQRLTESQAKERRLAQALALQAEQLKSAYTAHAAVQQLLAEPS